MGARINYNEGQIINNNLIYLREANNTEGKRKAYFKCHCGKEFIGVIAAVKEGLIVSCKCYNYRSDRPKYTATHGMSNTTEYAIGSQIKNRCFDPKNQAYYRYGGRGISMDLNWKNSFQSFIDHIGLRPSLNHSVDRIDNSKGYLPGNVKWSTDIEQANNTSKNVNITYNNITLSITEWGRKVNKKHSCLNKRLISGWSIQDILFYPTRKEIKMFESIGIKILPRDKNINLV